MQRIVLLQISRRYRIISNDAHNIFVGLPTTLTIIKYEFTKSTILLLENEATSQQYFPHAIQRNKECFQEIRTNVAVMQNSKGVRIRRNQRLKYCVMVYKATPISHEFIN